MPEFLETLPEDIRGEESLQGIEDVGGLATKFVELSKVPKNGDWRDQIPQELQDETCLKEAKDVAGLCKGYVDAQRYIGGSIRIPEDGDVEKMSELYRKLGRPETSDGYEYTRPEISQDPSWDEGAEKDFRGVAHDAGLNSKQVQMILNWYGGFVENTLRAGETMLSETDEGLRKEWGPNYERNLAYAERTVKQVGGEEIAQLLDETQLGNHPAVVRFFYKIGKEFVEDGIIPGEVEGVVGKEEALKQILELTDAKNEAYWKKDHPGHDEAVKKVFGLRKIAYD